MSASTLSPVVSKREFMKTLGAGALVTVLGPGARPAWAADPAKASMSADEALKKLMEGNRRHLAGQFEISKKVAERRQVVAKGQHPFAIILGCADSRVSPEIVFDYTLGDLFVVRVAGNIVHAPGLGSIEYAATHLGSPLVMVLGHQRCGAVAAALEGGKAPGHVGTLVDEIAPAVEEFKGKGGDALDKAVRANVRRVVAKLQSSEPILSALVKNGKLKVVGAYYSLDSGKVDIIS